MNTAAAKKVLNEINLHCNENHCMILNQRLMLQYVKVPFFSKKYSWPIYWRSIGFSSTRCLVSMHYLLCARVFE